MTADVGQAVADRLHRIAERARPADDDRTAARAVALDRHRRRRAGSWTAGALAVVLLGTGASLARSAVTEPAAAPTPAPVTSTYVAPRPPELVEAPTRGSLADDEEFLAAMAAAPWTGPVGPDGEVVDWGLPAPEPGTQRVLYAADVPGGDRWAVVTARSGKEWIWAWFIGPRGAEPAEMTFTNGYMPLGVRERLALVGASAETGPLVVLGEPGLEVEYSPSLDRAPNGELVRDFTPLPVVDGVPLGVVDIPVTWNAGEVRVTSGVGQQPVYPVFGGRPPSWPAFPTGPVDEALVAPCLEQLGLDVQTGSGLSWEEPEQLSSAEEAAREHEIAACFRAAEP
ncbi:hypothetical protein IN07_08955 [Modestobacter caceresii]|uniref:Uncharacterized protein n=1 Tax=Modestobacter caceresii TaxID=1522368 RepID=A0A098YB99_9ACTN|nr:hypothetical protein [Modestobacter caceresii]KGH47076.1 hypothetical protein IN07_08955 [Modestobacter caceresii]